MDGWKRLTCGGNDQDFLIKMSRSENESFYEITLCDLSNVWKEVLSSKEVVVRCKELNKRLEAPSDDVLQHLQRSINKHTSSEFAVTEQSDEAINLRLKNSFSGGIPFTWKFCCKKLNNNEKLEAFLSPMMKVITSLQCANEHLIKIIKKKDMEIQDYKDSGGKVTRAYLETTEFDQGDFMLGLRSSPEYQNLIKKDIVSITIDDVIGERLSEIQKDLISPLPTVSSGIVAGNKTMPPTKSPQAKTLTLAKNRRGRNVRNAPKGVEALSDSDSGSNDEASTVKTNVKRPVAVEHKKTNKKKKIDKRKKLF